MTVDLAAIQAAAALLAGEVVRTPTVDAPALSRLTGAEIVLKLENLQVTGSFKPRGALVKLVSLTDAQRRVGVVAMSAGNHAQGVAWHAARLNIPATIVMPQITPFTKVERTRALGARVVLEGESLSEAGERAAELAASEGLTFIPPYDDPAIIAGQGTVALEMLADCPDLEVLVIPIGGGGLCAGMAVAAKALNPAIEIIGVQAELYATFPQVLNGQPPHSGGQTLAEGIAVKLPGRLTVPIIRALVSDIVLVGEQALERAAHAFMEHQRIVAEGAAAAPLAAILAQRGRFAGRKVGLVVSGGNIDARLMASILMRGLARAGRMARLRIEISDAPGALGKVAKVIGDAAGNIIEIYHQRLFHDVPVKFAELDAVVETTNPRHVAEIIEKLREAGFSTRHLGDTADGVA